MNVKLENSSDVRTLKNLNRPQRYTIPNVKGLHLWVRSDGKKYFIFRFTFEGKRHEISLGRFPDVSLQEVKNKIVKIREQLYSGVNPIKKRYEKVDSDIRDENLKRHKVTFKRFSNEYIDRMSPKWTNDKHAAQWVATVKQYAFPVIGNMDVEDVSTQDILKILEPIWVSKYPTASRLRGRMEKILSSAISNGYRTNSNPANWRGHLENILPYIKKSQKHHPAMPYSEIPQFMRELIGNECLSSLALQFTILNASRTGEVIYAKRSEVKNDIWNIPADRMKMRREHSVPLEGRSLEILRMSYELDLNSEYIFSRNGKKLSSMAMLELLRGMRTGVTVHGFRSGFRDWVSNETNHSSEVAEMALAHTIQNKVEAAYRRGNLLEKRRALAKDWEIYCLSVN